MLIIKVTFKLNLYNYVPSHTGISGNDEIDELAKNLHDSTIEG